MMKDGRVIARRKMIKRSVLAILCAVAATFVSCKPRTSEPPPKPTAGRAELIAIAPESWMTSWIGDADHVTLAITNSSITFSLTGKPAGVTKGTAFSSAVNLLRILPGARVEFSLAAPDGDLRVALAVRTDIYYESEPVTVGPDARFLVYGPARAGLIADGTRAFVTFDPQDCLLLR